MAELLLSGLLRRAESGPDDTHAAGPGVELDFDEGVRRELLSDGTRGETARALTLALGHLAVAAPVYGEGVTLLREPQRAASRHGALTAVEIVYSARFRGHGRTARDRRQGA
ncbi:hypothetical protein [Streptomyces sp. San01]|uniref:hypothetical protein n=1 Tax=Streptomyces antnestii TaxID=2494256 RepID=UPI001CB9BCF0